MNVLLILVAVISFALNGVVTRAVQLRYPGRKSVLRGYQSLFCLTAAALFLLVQLVQGVQGGLLPALGYGVAFGVFFFVTGVSSAAGYEKGSMALTSIFINLSLFIPIVYSCLVYGERLTLLRCVGVVLIVLTVVLAVDRSKGGTPLQWWMVVLTGFAANGITAVLQKRYSMLFPDGPRMLFMTVAYLTAGLLYGLSAKERRRVVGFAALSGLGSFGGNGLLALLCTQVSAAVLYPCINGGLCVASALVSFMLFREKLTSRKLAVMIVGVIAIVLLNL